MDPRLKTSRAITRRAFLGRSVTGIGGLALASLLNGGLSGAALPQFAPKARRMIFLFMSGGPSHIDLFDPKPLLTKRQGEDLPRSLREGQRFSANTLRQDRLPMVGPLFRFSRHGGSGAELSELLPHTAKIADHLAIVRSVHTDSINHDPAVTFLLTGALQPGRPTLGSWLSYGLGSLNKSLPEYVVLLSGEGGQPLRSRYWGQG